MAFNHVVIVGAGPVGLLSALMLSQLDIDILVLEKEQTIDRRPRGASYGPPAVRVLNNAGIGEKARHKGLDTNVAAWKTLDGSYITKIEGLSDPSNPDRQLTLPVDRLVDLLYEEIVHRANVRVCWGAEVSSFTQSNDKVSVDYQHESRNFHVVTDFLLGSDGAHSMVRKKLFGESFPGKTWGTKVVAVNMRYDGFAKNNWTDVQWIVHPEHWFMACRLDDTGVWRVAYGESNEIANEELQGRLSTKLEAILPGHPQGSDYEIVSWSPFVMHQRCAEKMRQGRILLAGDAAHLCNPMGGLGLTGGIADVGSLVQCLEGIHKGEATLEILDKYDELRRQVYNNFTDPVSSGNLQRLWQDGETALQSDKGLRIINEASLNPIIAEQLKRMNDSLTIDMTGFYTSKP